MKDLLTTAEPIRGIVSIPCADVALPVPVPGPFSYRIPLELQEVIGVGMRVRVTFRNRELIGYVVEKKLNPETARLKPILAVLDEGPVLSPSILDLTRWISEYYGSSWGEAIENALPRWIKYGKKAERALAREEHRLEPVLPPKTDLNLSDEQKGAYQILQKALEEKQPKPILLYGVTGSGKSELYIRVIRDALGKGLSAICLVPEIALTEQLRRFFLHHFGQELEILHSKMSDGERFLAWKRLERGERHVVLGPRSAIFAPVQNLGLILIDEEHEGTYKQETTPRYHAREVAVHRARQEGALLVMGTATPSLETMHATEKGEFRRVDLMKRIDDKAMPAVTLIDLKDSSGSSGRKLTIFSQRLLSEIDANLKRKEGILLLLNRRGFSTHIHCPKCGNVETCVSCQVSLTFHQEDGTLLCHYCNYQKDVPDACGQCSSPMLRFAGFGTEKVESELARHFPSARIARMDADSVRKKGSHERILKEFREERTDILIGTQMIAKGFDFPHVTLVGVILADVGLMLPDFRSAERTFQLLTQVAGRAGRGKIPGRVFIQTYSPHHPSIHFAKDHDYRSFYQHETAERMVHHYPPFHQLINFIVRSRAEKKSYLFAKALRDLLKHEFSAPEIEIIGPAPLPFYKLRGHYRWHVMVKCQRHLGLSRKIMDSLSKIKRVSGVAMAMDVDPVNIL